MEAGVVLFALPQGDEKMIYIPIVFLFLDIPFDGGCGSSLCPAPGGWGEDPPPEELPPLFLYKA